jgi:hypothetical protein
MPTNPASQLLSHLHSLGPQRRASIDDRELDEAIYLLEQAHYDKLDARCALADVDERGWASESSGPLYWGQNLTKTIDDHAAAKGTPAKMPFPRKSYFRPLMGALMNVSANPRLLIPKSREMMTSWAICLYVTWMCQFRPGITAVVQTVKETKAAELVRYCTILAENQEPFLQERHPIEYSNAMEIGWTNGSRIFGIPGGEHQMRMFHPMIVAFDEMAFMEDAEACWNAAQPVAKQMIGISSAHPGWMGDQCGL